MAIETIEFDLSLINQETGRYNTACVYTIDGVKNVDGSLRELSIGQLVMAICLQRANILEYGELDETTGKRTNGIIPLMDDMEKTSAQLEAMTEIETEVLKWPDELTAAGNLYRSLNSYRVSSSNAAYPNATFKDALVDMGVIKSGVSFIRISGNPDPNDIMYDDFITAIESKMDEKNSFNQRTMIELQSLTNKRDQCYDMISNVLKSLNTVLVGIANNT